MPSSDLRHRFFRRTVRLMLLWAKPKTYIFSFISFLFSPSPARPLLPGRRPRMSMLMGGLAAGVGAGEEIKLLLCYSPQSTVPSLHSLCNLQTWRLRLFLGGRSFILEDAGTVDEKKPVTTFILIFVFPFLLNSIEWAV